MLTLNNLIEQKQPIDKPLTDKQKKELLNENKNNNYSYYCLLREYLTVTPSITVNDLLRGYSGVKLFEV